MYRMNFKMGLFLTLFVLLMYSCSKEGIDVPEPENNVVFNAKGTIDGQPFSMENSTLMVTAASSADTSHLYSGRLFSDCVGPTSNSCEQSLFIQIKDSSNNQSGSGYPEILEAGEKSIEHLIISQVEKSLEIRANQGDTLLSGPIHTTVVTYDEPLSIRPTVQFPEFEPIHLVRYNSAAGALLSLFEVVIMVSQHGDDILYFYPYLECTAGVDSCIELSVKLKGNAPFSANEFIIFPESSIDSFDVPFKIDDIDYFNNSIFSINALHWNLNLGFYMNFFIIDGSGGFSDVADLFCSNQFDILEKKDTSASSLEGIVHIEYTNKAGEVFTSGFADNLFDSFIINSTDPYLIDAFGNSTVISSISMDVVLYSSSSLESISLENVELIFGFGY